MTPIGEAFREEVLAIPRRLWGRAPQEAEVEVEDGTEPGSDDGDEDSDSDQKDEEDKGPPAANTPDIVNLPSVAGELKRQVQSAQADNINQPLPTEGLSQTTRTPLAFHTIGPDAPVLNLTPSTLAPTPQPSSSAVATRSAQTPAPAPVLPSSNTLEVSSTLSDIATGVSGAPTVASTLADAEATAGAAAAGGLNAGQVAGAAVGGLAAIAVVANIIFFYKRRRRRPAEIISPTPSTKETIRRVPEASQPRASSRLTPSALKFNFNAPRLPRDEWPKSMEVLESRVRAEYAATQRQEAQGQGYGDQGYQGQAYGGQEYQGQDYQGQSQAYQGRESYEARVYMR